MVSRAALPCGLALAAALAVGAAGWRGGMMWSIADNGAVTGSVGSACAATTCADTGANDVARLPLTEEQRGHIFDGIMKLRDAPVADVAMPRPAHALPGSVELQELPAGVTRDVPMVRGYKFVKLDDRVLLVSPLDRTVVAEMPRYRLIVD